MKIMNLLTLLPLLFIVAAPTLTLADDGDKFFCSGTEPFWTVVISQEKFTFKSDDNRLVKYKPVEPFPAVNHKIDSIRVYKTYSTTDDKKAIFVVQKLPCSDGTSDHRYDYQVIIVQGSHAFHGCCMQK